MKKEKSIDVIVLSGDGSRVVNSYKVPLPKKQNSKELELCNECGQSVMKGSGKFVNRTITFDKYIIRKEMKKPFPKGAYMCEECDHQEINKKVPKLPKKRQIRKRPRKGSKSSKIGL